MNDVKPWWKSITLWSIVGIIVLVVGTAALRRWGITLTDDERDWVNGVLVFLASTAGVGRLRATKQIGSDNASS